LGRRRNERIAMSLVRVPCPKRREEATSKAKAKAQKRRASMRGEILF
jgi:hypothetical protein